MDGPAPPAAPLGIGDIVERAIAVYRRAPGPLILAAAVPAVTVAATAVTADQLIAGGLTVRTLTEIATRTGGDLRDALALDAERAAELALVGAVTAVVALAILPIQAAALLVATARLHRGDPIDATDALVAGVRAAPRLIAAELVAILAVMLVGGAGVTAGVGAAVILGTPLPAIAAVLGLLIVLVYVAAGWTLVPAAVALEGSGPLRALGRSWRLAAGARWRILGLLLFVGVIQATVGVIAGALLGLPFGPGPRELVDLALGVLWAPLQSAVLAILFADLVGRAATPAA